jgi:hypothetical protein
LGFLAGFSWKSPVLNFTKILPMGAELIRVNGETDGRTDMTKLIGALHEYANAPKSAVVPTCDMKAYASVLEEQKYSPIILDLASRWRKVVMVKTWPLYPL